MMTTKKNSNIPTAFKKPQLKQRDPILSQQNGTAQPKILIAIPCMDMWPHQFGESLINLRKTTETHYAVKANSLIYDSRNNFAAHAIMNGYDRVLWLDSDMKFDSDLLTRLNADMDEHHLDFVSGIYFKRHRPMKPVVYKDLIYEVSDDNTINAKAISYTDYPRDSLFEVKGAGFGAVLTKTSMLKAVWEKYGPPFQPLIQMGEDLAFCFKATSMGYKLWCDSRIKAGHVGMDTFDEAMYLEQDESATDEPDTTEANI